MEEEPLALYSRHGNKHYTRQLEPHQELDASPTSLPLTGFPRFLSPFLYTTSSSSSSFFITFFFLSSFLFFSSSFHFLLTSFFLFSSCFSTSSVGQSVQPFASESFLRLHRDRPAAARQQHDGRTELRHVPLFLLPFT